jgi:hypothetical protein
MLIQTNDPKHYAEMRKRWVRSANPYSKDPTEGVLRVTSSIASQMPSLGLPYMPENGRAAFRSVLEFECPSGNGSVESILYFAEARGYCAHPCDWVPSSEGDQQFPKRYQPWASWLADNGYTPYYVGVPLTAQNFDSWKPNDLADAFRQLRRSDRNAADHLFATLGAKLPPNVRMKLVRAIVSGGMFHGLHPDDVPTIRQCLTDRDAKIRAYAEEVLKEMKGLETKEDHAIFLSQYFQVNGTKTTAPPGHDTDRLKIIISPHFHEGRVMRNCLSTNLDTLSSVLGITAEEFVRGFDLDDLKLDLSLLVMSTENEVARKRLALRLAEAGKNCPRGLFNDVGPDLWQMALEINLQSEYASTVFDFLGPKAGSLDLATIRRMKPFPRMMPSILNETATGNRPKVNVYDPLRIFGLVANKDAATELMDMAISAGMNEKNPRLTMLKLNLAL